jgi:hypothetical protein
MARTNIVHTTEYTYRNPVGLTRHRMMIRRTTAMICACTGPPWRLTPGPPRPTGRMTSLNNSICFLEWPETLQTEHLSIVSTLDLTHHPAGPTLPACSLDPAAEVFPFSYGAQEIPDIARLAERQLPDPNGTVDAWARHFVSALATPIL